jgi:hypothetical protein
LKAVNARLDFKEDAFARKDERWENMREMVIPELLYSAYSDRIGWELATSQVSSSFHDI